MADKYNKKGKGRNPKPEKRSAAEKKRTQDLESEIKLTKKLLEFEDDRIKKAEYGLKLGELNHEQLILTSEDGAKAQKQIKDSTAALREQRKAVEKLIEVSERGYSAGKQFVDQVLGVSDKWKGGFIGAVLGGPEAWDKFTKGALEALEPTNILGSSLAKIVESTMLAVVSFDSAQSSLAGLTGTGRSYGQNIIDVANANRQFGGGIAEAGLALGNLHVSMASFSKLSKGTQNNLAGLTIQMENFGISGTETGKIMEDLTAGFGIGVEEAATLFKQTVATLNEIGLTPQQISEGFQQAMPQLAHWGSESVDIFKKVAAASKGLSVEMSTLIGFAAQFDTFDGAASAVGKLNAMMGGDALNTYEMMNATEAERIELLLESIELNGVVWDDMNRFEKRAIANAAGITDMVEANKMFAGGLGAYRTAQAEMEATAGSTKQLEERSKAAVSIMQKMKQAVEMFAIAIKPLVETIHGMLDAFLKLDSSTREFWVKFAGFVALAMTLSGIIRSLAGLGSIFSLGAATGGAGFLASIAPLMPYLLGAAAIAGALALVYNAFQPSRPTKVSGERGRSPSRVSPSTYSTSASSYAPSASDTYTHAPPPREQPPTTVVLEVDGTKLAKVLIPHMNKRIDLRVKEAMKGVG